MIFRNFFLPHKDTHKKAHLISWEAILIYILLFILLQVGFSIVGYAKPGVLGISGDIDQKKLIELTNVEREKQGLPPVAENAALDQAAALKAQNMFQENYWAHFAPSGKTPWDFILGSGYKFTYAGENLAKNFYSSDEVVSAWMASTTHRENLLNPKYQDIGIAVVEGVLNGQKTTLVVQEFGTTENLPGQPLVNVSGKQTVVPIQEYNQKPELLAAVQTPLSGKPLLDPYSFSRTASLGLISLMVILLVADFIILKKRGVFRIASSRVAHMAILGVAAATLLNSNPGVIL
ncbi:TPA: hypothetical protein DD690_04745 [Candidatus Daviesbacteria bacterium]|uniref:SCP domain-containing protein n=1 Tax=Candidatus Daviesbacteria bacterium GW2011_GWF2_38_6 TaxID=1618432 RepID=A0A0G0MTZ0_9BACT|nr:MAG: hypothetical protein US80_C0001G0053 [Candidatus Daviesbacteria bacterium GW2011_GWA2_38_17]KKQ77119.1 MAG: hypothetical protein US99_C0048G0005 [Candidatus Daviesbacteria bacterium GW2011_GWF2_38_6]OGE27277.1 MAG: hypothetical protein A3D02_03165 [Candidatus Daviesbacteria bacterium RIFCSPHIGHO2_02_FULL_39_41]OGE45003.1 MAG: hypothetical protein A3E67_02475 [Candidatus Daviesbacteria bacterium RIFCSPHIGHO2_12_FULL_38_25]OGE68475.1 MAG: hypothetical protein A3H81_05985 [Candidatus Davie